MLDSKVEKERFTKVGSEYLSLSINQEWYLYKH